jgi:hypothetical protein
MADAQWAYTIRASRLTIADDPGSPALSPPLQSTRTTPTHSSQRTEKTRGWQDSQNGGLRVHERLPRGLEKLQSTIQEALSLVFDLNTARAPMIMQLRQSMPSFKAIVQQLPDQSSPGEPQPTSQTATDNLKQTLQYLIDDPFASLLKSEDKCAHVEDQIVQLLFRSESYLQGLLNYNDPEWPVELDSDAISANNSADAVGRADVPPHSAIDRRYLSCIGDVDLLRERLADMLDGKSRLREEQITRESVGLSLDEDSMRYLASVDEKQMKLEDELEYAALGQQALKELVHDEEARRITNEALDSEPDENVSPSFQDNATVAADSSSVNAMTPGDSHLYRSIQSLKINFADYLADTSTGAASTAKSINIWLLQRIQCLPQVLNWYTSYTEKNHDEILPEDMINVFMDKWFHDGSTTVFETARDSADQNSIEANIIDSQVVGQQSLSARSLRSPPVPLMRTGPYTTTQQIIDQATQIKGISSSQSENG